jgi:CHAD domain-containing protein
LRYRFSNDETVGEAFARVLGELVDDSLGRLDDLEPGNANRSIHETRKNCKKGRALARLVRPALGDAFVAVNRAQRDAARVLAPFRDPHAILASFDALIASAPEMVPETGVSGVRAVLAHRSSEATHALLGPESHRLRETGRLLVSVGEETKSLAIPHDFSAMRGGLKRTYTRGRAGLEATLKTPHDAAFHEWRKRVKYLWYHMRLVREAAPSILEPLALSLHDLSDALGDVHDLSILLSATADMDSNIPGLELKAARVMARERKSDLEKRAIAMGRRLYVETPAAFVARMEGYWAMCSPA